jgi:hypothetical protein
VRPEGIPSLLFVNLLLPNVVSEICAGFFGTDQAWHQHGFCDLFKLRIAIFLRLTLARMTPISNQIRAPLLEGCPCGRLLLPNEIFHVALLYLLALVKQSAETLRFFLHLQKQILFGNFEFQIQCYL